VAENGHPPLTWHIASTTVYALTCYTVSIEKGVLPHKMGTLDFGGNFTPRKQLTTKTPFECRERPANPYHVINVKKLVSLKRGVRAINQT